MNEAVCGSETNGGICSEGSHRVEAWTWDVSDGVVGESGESNEYGGELA